MASPAERVNWIVRVSTELQAKSSTDERMTLNQFRIPDCSGSGSREEIRSARLQAATDETLESLWRFVAGVEASTLATSSESDLLRIWGRGAPRVFLSHRAENKTFAKQLKDELAVWRAAVFVAHDDIEPTRAWQSEIERALRTMDVLVAVVSNGFSGSAWTNQEVGVAIGRGVPILAVRLDEDPPAFIGAVQAIPGSGATATKIAESLIAAMSGYEPLIRPLLVGLVLQWESVESYVEGMHVIGLLDACKVIPPDLLARIEHAHATNNQLYGSAGVAKRYPSFIKRMKAARSR